MSRPSDVVGAGLSIRFVTDVSDCTGADRRGRAEARQGGAMLVPADACGAGRDSATGGWFQPAGGSGAWLLLPGSGTLPPMGGGGIWSKAPFSAPPVGASTAAGTAACIRFGVGGAEAVAHGVEGTTGAGPFGNTVVIAGAGIADAGVAAVKLLPGVVAVGVNVPTLPPVAADGSAGPGDAAYGAEVVPMPNAELPGRL
ncbi:MAG: hypothetical protein ACYCW6_30140 [Candidatus Xenobia bacterium]